MVELEGAHFVTALCYWLCVRLQRMPWVVPLRRMTFREVQRLVGELGVDVPRTQTRQRLVASLVASASKNQTLKERLLRDLCVTGGRQLLAKASAGGFESECPEIVRLEVTAFEMPGRMATSTPDAVALDPPSLRSAFEQALVQLGPLALEGMSTKYIPEAFRPVGAPETLARRLARCILSIVPSSTARTMLKLEAASFVGAVCHWLGARLLSMPWVESLKLMTRRELADLSAKLSLVVPRTCAVCPFVEKIVAAAAEDEKLRAELLRELAISPQVLAVNASLRGYIDECPEVVRRKFEGHQNGHGSGGIVASDTYAMLCSRLERALLALGSESLQSFVHEFAPEAGLTRSPRKLARRVARLVPTCIPLEAAHEMLSLSDADLVGRLSHCFGVRLQSMPWLETLRRMTPPELYALSSTLGRSPPVTHTKPRLVKEIFVAASQDRLLRGNLFFTSWPDRGAMERCPMHLRRGTWAIAQSPFAWIMAS